MIDLTEIANERDKDFHLREDIFGDKTIPVQVVESIRKVIDYAYADEFAYTQYLKSEHDRCEIEDKDDHIFTHLTRVNDWVNELIDSNTHNINE
jgi:hypothetical protein